MVDEVQIALATYDILTGGDGSRYLDEETLRQNGWNFAINNPDRIASQLNLLKLREITKKLAISRVKENPQLDFEAVLAFAETKVAVELANIVSKIAEPVLNAVKWIEIDENDENVCAICLDEMVNAIDLRAMNCNHAFHGNCILNWLSRKLECPVCRYSPIERSNEKDDDDYQDD
ncbi:hypothetical protein ACH5RR_031784 [Cinchona calisaya]|uniref:RING-type E3 ubiquitin transferase n=1 Tax=Cinchona calisaya TaxID=153742 RepID=A0ABD2YKM9_9GENT